jgi:hypothetical protein
MRKKMGARGRKRGGSCIKKGARVVAGGRPLVASLPQLSDY